MANRLKLQCKGAVGFIVWLDPLLHPLVLAAIVELQIHECPVGMGFKSNNRHHPSP